MSSTRIFLLTDFGHDDEFVGVLHAVIARLAPELGVVDLSHEVAPFDVAGGAALLARAFPHLGPGVVCAVVDPGVGGARRGVAVELDADHDRPSHLVGPDNGLLAETVALAGGARAAVSLTAPERIAHRAATFDGRDLFAPVAARLATGTAIESLGEPVDPDSLVGLTSPATRVRTLADGRLAYVATVRWIDRFGNAQLSLPGDVLVGVATVGVVVRDDDALVRVVRTFDDLDAGTAGLLRDANDAVALVVGRGSAQRRFDLAVGDRVELVGTFGPSR